MFAKLLHFRLQENAANESIRLLLAVIADSVMLAFVTDVTVMWSVCPSVTLVQPAKPIGWNEMPFCRDTCVALNSMVSDGPWFPGLRVGKPSQNLHCMLWLDEHAVAMKSLIAE